jgi:hypothetical protein
MDEMRLLAGTIEAAEEPYPELYWRHYDVCKKLARGRDALRREAKTKRREEYYDTMQRSRLISRSIGLWKV